MQYYEIVKFYQANGTKPRLQNGLVTLECAREICGDKESSSKTAKSACNGKEKTIERWNDKQKHWFLGFRKV